MFLVFDIGGTHTRIAASHDGYAVEKPITFNTNPNNFEAGINELLSHAQRIVGKDLRAIAGGVPGPLNGKKTHATRAPNIPGWNDMPLKSRLEEALGVPTHLENDTAMTGLGEAMLGAGIGHQAVAYLTVSTGVGGCLIINGSFTESAFGFEPGHQIIDADGPLCNCGGKGHLEAFISGASLKKRFGQAPEYIADPLVWSEVARYLAIGLNNVLTLWSPHIIILGGAVMQRIDINTVRDHLETLVTIFPVIPPIASATLGEMGGLLGSLEYLKRIYTIS